MSSAFRFFVLLAAIFVATSSAPAIPEDQDENGEIVILNMHGKRVPKPKDEQAVPLAADPVTAAPAPSSTPSGTTKAPTEKTTSTAATTTVPTTTTTVPTTTTTASSAYAYGASIIAIALVRAF